MNYASLYNMRSCFTVKRGGDPRDLWHRRRRRCCCGMTTEEDTAAPREREGNISRINFAIGEFYVRAGSIYYGRAFAATPIHRSSTDRPFGSWACLFFFFLFYSSVFAELGTNSFVSAARLLNIWYKNQAAENIGYVLRNMIALFINCEWDLTCN